MHTHGLHFTRVYRVTPYGTAALTIYRSQRRFCPVPWRQCGGGHDAIVLLGDIGRVWTAVGKRRRCDPSAGKGQAPPASPRRRVLLRWRPRWFRMAGWMLPLLRTRITIQLGVFAGYEKKRSPFSLWSFREKRKLRLMIFQFDSREKKKATYMRKATEKKKSTRWMIYIYISFITYDPEFSTYSSK